MFFRSFDVVPGVFVRGLACAPFGGGYTRFYTVFGPVIVGIIIVT